MSGTISSFSDLVRQNENLERPDKHWRLQPNSKDASKTTLYLHKDGTGGIRDYFLKSSKRKNAAVQIKTLLRQQHGALADEVLRNVTTKSDDSDYESSAAYVRALDTELRRLKEIKEPNESVTDDRVDVTPTNTERSNVNLAGDDAKYYTEGLDRLIDNFSNHAVTDLEEDEDFGDIDGAIYNLNIDASLKEALRQDYDHLVQQAGEGNHLIAEAAAFANNLRKVYDGTIIDLSQYRSPTGGRPEPAQNKMSSAQVVSETVNRSNLQYGDAVSKQTISTNYNQSATRKKTVDPRSSAMKYDLFYSGNFRLFDLRENDLKLMDKFTKYLEKNGKLKEAESLKEIYRLDELTSVPRSSNDDLLLESLIPQTSNFAKKYKNLVPVQNHGLVDKMSTRNFTYAIKRVKSILQGQLSDDFAHFISQQDDGFIRRINHKIENDPGHLTW